MEALKTLAIAAGGTLIGLAVWDVLDAMGWTPGALIDGSVKTSTSEDEEEANQ